MKTVIIGAGSEALHTIRIAKEQGLVVAAIDGNPEAAGLKEADEAFVINISDEEESIQKIKEFVSDMSLKARSSKTSKKNIKVTLTVDKDTAAAIKEIKEMGYYRFDCTKCDESVLCPKKAPFLERK